MFGSSPTCIIERSNHITLFDHSKLQRRSGKMTIPRGHHHEPSPYNPSNVGFVGDICFHHYDRLKKPKFKRHHKISHYFLFVVEINISILIRYSGPLPIEGTCTASSSNINLASSYSFYILSCIQSSSYPFPTWFISRLSVLNRYVSSLSI